MSHPRTALRIVSVVAFTRSLAFAGVGAANAEPNTGNATT
jgi:hypothetical protein